MNDAQSQTTPETKQVFSTEAVGAERWRDTVCNNYPGFSMDWVRQQPRPAWLGTRQFADAHVIEFASRRPMRVVSTPSPSGFSDAYHLALLASGNCRSRHVGREAVWGAGDLMLFDNAQPFDILHPGEFHVLTCALPREAVAPMLAAPDRSTGVRISGSGGPGAVLRNYLRALLSESKHLDADVQRSLLTHLYGLVGLALGSSPMARQSRQETARAVRRQQILAYIEAHLRDPRLTVQRAACELRMSPRWLHALLEQSGISFAAWVARRRLEECQRLLNDPESRHLSVSEIAFRAGFNNLSAFNRRFRAQYGMTPRDMRWLSERKGR